MLRWPRLRGGLAWRLVLCAVAVAAAPPAPSKHNVEWLSATPFDGKQYADGMPTGNGDVVVLAWGDPVAGGLEFYVRSARSQHTDSVAFTIARVLVSLSPNPFAAGSYWNQTLHLETGEVTVHGGGRSFTDHAVSLSIFVDIDSPTVVITAAAKDGVTPYSLHVDVSSVRPSTRLEYPLPYSCYNKSSTGPDVLLEDPVPSTMPEGSLAIFHKNDVASGDRAFFRDTMLQQGLEALLDRFHDPLDGRIFGLGLVGEASGADGSRPLKRVSSTRLASSAPASAFVVTASVLVQTDAKGDEEGWLAELGRSLAESARPSERLARTTAWWTSFWARSYIDIPGRVLLGTEANASSNEQRGGIISRQYALTRFVQAVQSRTEVPIKFNGMLFLNRAGHGGPNDVDYRQWGPGNWWQDTRLAYGNMLKSGDYDTMKSVLDWITSFLPLALARTALLLPEESGVFFTETVTAFGAYQQHDYGCSRPKDYPAWLSANKYLHFDFGGDGPGLEGGLMAIDYYLHTGDLEAARSYLPLATHTVDFYMSHYKNRTSDGQVIIWPTQVLETYWCEWPGWQDCCQDDLPQVAGLRSLLSSLLRLPDASGLLTAQQRTSYTDFFRRLPPLPLQGNGKLFAPAASWSHETHNVEVPELFAVHPFRLFTVGRASVEPESQVGIEIGVNTFRALPLAKENTGWYYGIIDAALLGLAEDAFKMVQERATQAPAQGYRFPGFAQHYQAFPPSSEHFANHNTALQHMLMQLGEDGHEPGTGTLVLLPAWPCRMDVSFKLWAPWNTTVEVVYEGGKLRYLDVQPSGRRGDVRWANCVQSWTVEYV